MQSVGQLISTCRFVAQQTVQMVAPSAGHERFGFRSLQDGHFCCPIGQDGARPLQKSPAPHRIVGARKFTAIVLCREMLNAGR